MSKKAREDSGPGEELDVLKFYVWMMAVMTVALGVALIVMRSRVDDARAQVDRGQKKLIEFAETKGEVVAMLDVFKENNEDQARTSPFTWFSNVWRAAGIPDNSIKMGSWAEPRYDTKGKYWEESIRIAVENRQPLPRKKIVEFCHEVERASTRLRILALELRRADTREGAEEDSWSGRVTIGYRLARVSD